MQIIFAVAMFLTTAIAGFAPFKVSLNERKIVKRSTNP